jgi:Ca2+-binding RTX toxin-like protein
VLDDTIDGGADQDFILGEQGNDNLLGSSESDVVFGNTTAVLPDRYEVVTNNGQSARNDSFQYAQLLPGFAADHDQNGTTIGKEGTMNDSLQRPPEPPGNPPEPPKPPTPPPQPPGPPEPPKEVEE